MARVRHKDSKAELALRSALWARGYRYRLHDSRIPGKPDLVFRGARVTVFVDGDFWHARAFVEGGREALEAEFRGRRKDWWLAKLSRTAERDREVTASLEAEEWTVVRVWESDILDDAGAIADDVAKVIDRKQGMASQGLDAELRSAKVAPHPGNTASTR